MGKINTALHKEQKNIFINYPNLHDDVIFGSTNELLCEEFSACTRKEFEMSMMEELNFFLRLQIKQGKNEIFINQSEYVKDLFKRFTMKKW